MRPSEALNLHRTRIREIALSHRVSGVRVFGSALRGDDVAGSDLDLLVEPTPQTTLMDIGAIRFELKKLLGLKVDVLTPNGLPARAGFARRPAGMSRADPLRIADYLQHVIEAINSIQEYTAGMELAAYMADRKTRMR